MDEKAIAVLMILYNQQVTCGSSGNQTECVKKKRKTQSLRLPQFYLNYDDVRLRFSFGEFARLYHHFQPLYIQNLL